MVDEMLSTAQASVLNDILEQQPILDHDQFIVSTAFEHRQSIGDRGQLVNRTVIAQPLPEWLEPASALGPYERMMLFHFLHGAEPLLIIRSGTGSGKSSILAYIAWFLSNPETRNLAPLSAISSARNLLSIIDFETLDAKFTVDLDKRDKYDAYFQNLSEIKTLVAARVGQALLQNVTDQGVVFELVRSLTNRAGHFQTGLRNAIHTLGQQLRKRPDWSRTSLTNNDELESAIHEVRDPHQQLLIWLALWSELARQPPLALGKLPLILAFDNIDQMATYLQREVCTVLQQFFADCQPDESAFRIVFMMRLASAIDKYYSLPQRYVISAHEPPDAVDVIATRVLAYLLNPINERTVLNPAEARELYDRLFVFYLNLIDTKGEMRRLLRGLAGTNLRTAHSHAKKWVASRRVNSLKIPSGQIDAARRELLRQLAPNVFVKIAHAIGRAMQVLFLESRIGPEQELLVSGDAEWSMRFVGALAEKIGYVLHHSRLLPLEGVGGFGLRASVGAITGAEAADILLRREHEVAAHRTKLVQYFVEIFSGCQLVREPQARELGSQVAAEAKERLAASVQEYLHRRQIAGHAMVPFAVALVVEGLQIALGKKPSEGASLPLSGRALQQVHRVDFEHLNGAIRGSRYNAARILLEGASTEHDDDMRAANLFSVGHDKPSLAPLYLLYRIAERPDLHESPNSVSYKRLAVEAATLQMTGDFHDALRAFIRRDRRIVFCGVDDEARDVEAWKDDPDRTVHLTWAGQRYFRDVVRMPTYLQWAFSAIPSLQVAANYREEDDQSIFGRVGFALDSFKQLVTIERRLLERLASRFIGNRETNSTVRRQVFRTIGFKSGGPVADVYFRSTPAFLEALRNAGLGLARRAGPSAPSSPVEREAYDAYRARQDLVRVRRLIKDWLDAALPFISRYRDMYGDDTVRAWEEILAFERRATELFERDLLAGGH